MQYHEYRTFSVGVLPDGNLEFVESQQELPSVATEAPKAFLKEVDWDGSVQGTPVIAVGIEIHPGLDYGWGVYSRQEADRFFENVSDEELGDLVGQTLPPAAPSDLESLTGQKSAASVDADSVVRDRTLGQPDVQS